MKMQQPFNHIVTILFKHQYFSNNQFKSINISYEKETSKLLRNLDVIVKSFPGGVHLLSSAPELMKLQGETEEPLRLQLTCWDDVFINYTDLPPYRPGDSLLYFNNQNINLKAKDNRFLLHVNEFVDKNEIVPIGKEKITIPQFDKKKKYVFTDVSGHEIPLQNIRQALPDSGDFYIVNTSEGIINIQEGETRIGKVYNYTNAVWRKPLGILEIFPGKLYEHFKEKGKIEYVINFNNRKTIWKYFLVDPVFQKFTNLTIINKAKEQVFKTPEKKQFHEEMEALVFESKNKIPISEFSNNTFQLVDSYDPKSKSGKVILKNLANASPEQLYRDETNSNEIIYSHIFI